MKVRYRSVGSIHRQRTLFRREIRIEICLCGLTRRCSESLRNAPRARNTVHMTELRVGLYQLKTIWDLGLQNIIDISLL